MGLRQPKNYHARPGSEAVLIHEVLPDRHVGDLLFAELRLLHRPSWADGPSEAAIFLSFSLPSFSGETSHSTRLRLRLAPLNVGIRLQNIRCAEPASARRPENRPPLSGLRGTLLQVGKAVCRAGL